MSPPGGGPRTAPIARQALNTVQVGVVPVIVIPGVMGSRLRLHSYLGGTLVWDPDNPYAMGLLAALPIGPKRFFFAGPCEVIQDPRPQGFPEVAWGFYGSLITDLTDSLEPDTTPVYALGYDWRQSNLDSGKIIAQRVSDILASHKAKRAILVTHSMGGLVARAALKAVPGFQEKVLGVIHCVQPALGAARAYANFVVGPEIKLDAVGFGLWQILGPWDWHHLALMSTLPGPVQLLPNNEYRLPASGAVMTPPAGLQQPVSASEWLQAYGDDGQWGFSSDIFDVYRGYGVPGIVQHWQFRMLPHYLSPAWDDMMAQLDDHLLTAKGLHEQLKGYMHPLTKTLVSQKTSETVLGVISFTHEGVVGSSTDRTLIVGAGDGTVPYVSQSALPGTPGSPEPITRVDGEHGAIFSEPKARDFVKRCILSMLER